MPFGEYVPGRNTVPFIARIVGDQVPADFTRGKEPVVFRLTNDEVKVAPLICFEDTLGELTRQFVLRGANLLANVTNDGWFLRSAGSRQHLENAIFRCIETRRPMVRAANTGVTCFVNRFGRVTQVLLDAKGSQFTEGVLTGNVDVPTDGGLTFYVRHGELFAQVCGGVDAAFSLRSMPGSLGETVRMMSDVSDEVDASSQASFRLARDPVRSATYRSMTMNDSVIYARGLRKSYGALEAVKGIDFEVQRRRSLRSARAERRRQDHHGRNSRRPAAAQRRRSDGARLRSRPAKAGVEGSDRRLSAGDESCRTKSRCTKRSNSSAAFYTEAGRWRCAPEAACSFGKNATPDYATLSGGQKQRLALALALINDPQMLFLDEPTTGLDPQVRLEIRDLIEELRAEKRTILMTTHYIEEAERLCDRVAIIDDGVIIAIGSPRELQEKSATQSSIEISLAQPLPAANCPPGRTRFARS